MKNLIDFSVYFFLTKGFVFEEARAQRKWFNIPLLLNVRLEYNNGLVYVPFLLMSY